MAKSIAVTEQSIRTRIAWEIRNFHLEGDFESGVFTLLGSQCVFQFYRAFEHSNTPAICIKRVITKVHHVPFHATSFIETPEGLPKFCQTCEIQDLLCHPWPGNVLWSAGNIGANITEGDAEWLTGDVTFVLLCNPTNVNIGSGKEQKSTQTHCDMDYLSDLERLSSDFRNLLTSDSKTDVSIKCGDHTISAHSVVLSARSEVFSSMFRSGMMESCTGLVDIVDVEQSVLDQLLKYLYTGIVPVLSVENAQSLYAAGSKYAVIELENKCRRFLLENMDEENAHSLLVFSDAHSDNVLKNAVVDFFVRNGELLKSDAWIKFSEEQPRLAVDVYRAYISKN